jgi:hypothetical protein
MKSYLAIYLPLVRFAAHATSSAFGFLILLIAALIPFYGIKWILPHALVERVDWDSLELYLVYTDIVLYGLSVLFWAIVFIVEEVRAVIDILRRK